MTRAEAKEGEAKTRVGSVVGNIKEWKVKDEQKGGRTEGGQGTVKEWIGRGDQGQAFQSFGLSCSCVQHIFAGEIPAELAP